LIREENDDRLKSTLEEVWNKINLHRPSAVMITCIASFTTSCDLLSQWRGYANNGQGYCIGLDLTKAQLPHAEDGPWGFKLARCVYGADEFTRLLREYIRPALGAFHRYVPLGKDPTERWTILRNGLLNILAGISALIPSYKHYGFSEEQEWRLVALVPPDRVQLDQEKVPEDRVIQFRPSSTGVIPYVRIPVGNPEGKLPISTLVLGPNHDLDRSMFAVGTLLESHGYDRSLLRASSIPYRG
jgi:hypothetical protein